MNAQTQFVESCLVRMLDPTTKALPESLLWDVCERLPELAELAQKVIVTRYPSTVQTVETSKFVPTAEYAERAGEREGEAMERLAALLDESAAIARTVQGGDILATSIRRACRAARAGRGNVANRAHRFAKREGRAMLPRYPRQKFIKWWDATCYAIENQLPLPKPTALPLCLADYARRAAKKMRRDMIRAGKLDRETIKKELAKLQDRANHVPLSQYVAEARAQLA